MKNSKNKIALFVMIAILIIVVVYAKEEQGGSLDFDPNDEEAYFNPEFYDNVPPSRWNLNYVQWEQIEGLYPPEIFDIAEVYQQSGFYENLPDDDYGKLDYTQVDYSHPALNHQNIDGTKYLQDLGCYSCDFEWSQLDGTPPDEREVKMTYSKEGITHSNGDKITIPGNWPDEIKVIAGVKGFEVILPKYLTLGTDVGRFISEEDTIMIDLNREDIWLDERKNFEYKGHTLQGTFVFDHGQIYLVDRSERGILFGALAPPSKPDALIDGVAIVLDSWSSEDRVPLYFDGEKHDGTYIAMDQSDQKISAVLEADSTFDFITFDFTRPNPYLDQELSGESIDGSERTNEVVILSLGKGTELNIQEREGLIPKIEVIGVSEEFSPQFSMNNGFNSFEYYKDMYNYDWRVSYFKSWLSPKEKGSLPLALIVKDENGNPLEETFIFDGEQGYALVPSEYPEALTECDDCESQTNAEAILVYKQTDPENLYGEVGGLTSQEQLGVYTTYLQDKYGIPVDPVVIFTEDGIFTDNCEGEGCEVDFVWVVDLEPLERRKLVELHRASVK